MRACLLLLSLLCAPAHAHEEEAAFPLLIKAQRPNQGAGPVHIRLDGSDVALSFSVSNNTNAARRFAYYAHTPLFYAADVGEENAARDFASLRVTVDGKNITLAPQRRAFFMGRDVTQKLRRAGIDPLPRNGADTPARKRVMDGGLPVEDWEGYVAYGWAPVVKAQSTSLHAIGYRALPQFGIDGLPFSDRFAALIVQHCGNLEDARQALRGLDHVMFDRYEIPAAFRWSNEGKLSVTQQPVGQKRPLLSLACGLSERSGAGADFRANIDFAGAAVSVLVISAFAGSVAPK